MVVINGMSGGHCDEFERRGSHLSSVNDHRVALSSADPTTNEAKNNDVVVDTFKVDLITQKNNLNSTYADNNGTDNMEQRSILNSSFEIDKAEQRAELMADTENDNVNGENRSISSTEIDNFDQISCDAPFESRNGIGENHFENNEDLSNDLSMDNDICCIKQETIENSNESNSLDMETTHSFDLINSKSKGKGNKRRKRAPWKSDNRRQKNSKGRPTRAEMPYEELLKLREKERIAQQLRRQRIRRFEGRFHQGSKSKGKKIVAKKTFLPQNGEEFHEVENGTEKVKRPNENGKRVVSAKIFMPVDNASVSFESEQKIKTEEDFSDNQRFSDELTASSNESFKKCEEITPSGPQSVERNKVCTVKTKLFVPKEISAENPKTDFMQALGLRHSIDGMNFAGMPENSVIIKQLVEKHGLYDDSVSSRKASSVEARCWVPENPAVSHFEERFTQKYLDDNGGNRSDHSWSEASSDCSDKPTDACDRVLGGSKNTRRSTLPKDELEKLREKERLAKRKQRSKCRKDFGSNSTTEDQYENGEISQDYDMVVSSNANSNEKQEKEKPFYATEENEFIERKSTGIKTEDVSNEEGENFKLQNDDIHPDQREMCSNDGTEERESRVKSNEAKKKTFGRLYDRSMLGPEELESLRRREREYQRKRRARLKEEKFKSLGDVLLDEVKETAPTKVDAEPVKEREPTSLDDSHRKYETRMSKGISRPSLRFLEHTSISFFESENFDPTLERGPKAERDYNGHPSRYDTDNPTLERGPKVEQDCNGHYSRYVTDNPTLERGPKAERDYNGHPSRYDTDNPTLERGPKVEQDCNGHPSRYDTDNPTLERGLKVGQDCNGHYSRYVTDNQTLERGPKVERDHNGHPSRYGTDNPTLELGPKVERGYNGHLSRYDTDNQRLEQGPKVEQDCNGHASRYDTNDPLPCQSTATGSEDIKPRMPYSSSDMSNYGYYHDNGYVEEFRSAREAERFHGSYRRKPSETENYNDTDRRKPKIERVEDVYDEGFDTARSKSVEGIGEKTVDETTMKRSQSAESAVCPRSSPVFGFMSEKKFNVSDVHEERTNEHIEHPLGSRSHNAGDRTSRSPQKRSPDSRSPHLKSLPSISPNSISPHSRGPHSSSPHSTSPHTHYNVMPSFVDRKSPLIDALYASDYKILQANGFKLLKNEDSMGPHCYDIPSDKRMFSTEWLDKYSPSLGSDSYGKFDGHSFYNERSHLYNCDSGLQEPGTEKKSKTEVGDDIATSRWRNWKSGLTDMQLQRRRQSNREAQRRRRLRLRLMQMKSLEHDQIPVDDIMYKRYTPNNREMVTEAIKGLNLPRTKLKTMLEKKQEIFMNAQKEKFRNETEPHVLAATQPPNSAKARGCRVKVTPKRQVVVPSMGYAIHAENRMARDHRLFHDGCGQNKDMRIPNQMVHPREDRHADRQAEIRHADDDYSQHQNDQEHQDQLAMEDDQLQNTNSRKRKQFCPRRLLSEPERRSQDGLPSVVIAQ